MIQLAYCSVDDVRILLGFDESDITDSEINNLITIADARVIADLTALHVDEVMYGDIDGSNTVFYTKHRPIADSNADKVVDTSEVTVAGYTDKDDYTTREVLAISSVDAIAGKVTLSTAPSGYEVITATYRSYFKQPDWELVKLASVYFVGYLTVLNKFALVPIEAKLGAMNYKFKPEYNLSNFYDAYMRIIETLRGGNFYIDDIEKLKYKDRIVSERVNFK